MRLAGLSTALALNVPLASSGERRHQRRKRGCRLIGSKTDLRLEPADGRTVLRLEDGIKDVQAISFLVSGLASLNVEASVGSRVTLSPIRSAPHRPDELAPGGCAFNSPSEAKEMQSL